MYVLGEERKELILWKFLQAFNGKKWEKFNSEKVASLAYARIQGKAALVAHFQNSSLMNEDKRCRPILFHSEGQETDDQVIYFSQVFRVSWRAKYLFLFNSEFLTNNRLDI